MDHFVCVNTGDSSNDSQPHFNGLILDIGKPWANGKTNSLIF